MDSAATQSPGRISDIVDPETKKAKGAENIEEVSNAERRNNDTSADVPGVSREGDASSSSSDSSATASEGFRGWARVFFQGRSDRVSTQLHPTNSSTLARDSYLYVEVDPDATQLRIYPSEAEMKKNKNKILVDPPIDLKYFYGARVPGSNEGAALFLKEDFREYQRYIFRFEFRNDTVLQPAARMYQLARSGKAAKHVQRMNWAMGNKFKPKKTKNEDERDEKHADEKQSLEILNAYIGSLEELTRDSVIAAESFVDLVNSAVPEEGSTWGRPRRHGTSWGAGYEDVERERDDGGDSDYSSDETDSQYGEYKESSAARATEKLEESFERVFGAISKRSKDV
uniref:Uncharacterized protein n=1 Tax=Odontella aurita TaxID=265563 RepID=A0A7S4MPM5_9STRA|mmetsp:Transcript_2763/g.7257  ORF Transcript_2763/g.7257 Transcript_2763/m.7257 type:complete len:342 (+) Transcript_2763:92-1117(+)